MLYYVKEICNISGIKKTAGVKARDDANAIFEQLHANKILIEDKNYKSKSIIKKLASHVMAYNEWKKKLKKLKRGDAVIIQFPALNHSLLLYKEIKKMEANGIKTILLVHDLELLRVSKRKDVSFFQRVRLALEEKKCLNACSKIIAHNIFMKNYLISLGIQDHKICVLEIFDYLINEFDETRIQERMNGVKLPAIIAGTLRKHKAGYIYDLPLTPKFNLYGVGYDENYIQMNVSYKGAFDPDELPYVLEGSFGVVWDGENSITCSGIYGEYLKINNPHKTSLYLAAGIPVAIWKDAALAKFIDQYKCGILLDSLNELDELINNMTPDEYQEMLKNAVSIGKLLRQGYFLQTAVNKCLKT